MRLQQELPTAKCTSTTIAEGGQVHASCGIDTIVTNYNTRLNQALQELYSKNESTHHNVKVAEDEASNELFESIDGA